VKQEKPGQELTIRDCITTSLRTEDADLLAITQDDESFPDNTEACFTADVTDKFLNEPESKNSSVCEETVDTSTRDGCIAKETEIEQDGLVSPSEIAEGFEQNLSIYTITPCLTPSSSLKSLGVSIILWNDVPPSDGVSVCSGLSSSPSSSSLVSARLASSMNLLDVSPFALNSDFCSSFHNAQKFTEQLESPGSTMIPSSPGCASSNEWLSNERSSG